MSNIVSNATTAMAMAAITVLTLSACASSDIKTFKIDRLVPEQLASLQQPANRKLTPDDLIALSRAGTAPADIIKRLQDSGTILQLNDQQKLELGNQHVDQAVIDHITTTHARAIEATRITQAADREAMQAQQQARERQQRRALEQQYYHGYSPYGYWGPHPGWVPGYYYNNPAIGIGIWRYIPN